MKKSAVKDALARSGFVLTDLDSGARISASGPQVPGPVGQKTLVCLRDGGETVHRSRHASNAAAARRYVQLVERYE